METVETKTGAMETEWKQGGEYGNYSGDIGNSMETAWKFLGG